MKGIRFVVAAIALLMMAGVAVAADTANITVNATVNGACRFRSVPTVDFPALDPSVGTAVDSPTVNLTFNCTRGVAYTLSDPVNPGVGDGTYSGTLVGPDPIAYTLTYTNATGSGTGGGVGNALTSAITGHIAAGAYDLARAGAYTETVVFTISP